MTQFQRDMRPAGQQLRRNIQDVLTAPLNARSPKPYQIRGFITDSEGSRPYARSVPRKVSTDDAFRQQYRPKSGAEAFLVLERDADGRISRRLPELPRARRYEEVNNGALTMPRGSRTHPSKAQAFIVDKGSRSMTDLQRPENRKTGNISDNRSLRTVEDALTGPCDATPRARAAMGENCLLTRNIRSKKIRRVSKALPALPRESKDCLTPAPIPDLPSDLPQKDQHAGTHSRGLSTLRSAPQLSSAPTHYSSSTSSTSSTSTYASAEVTWNMIENMMHAVGEDEVKRARMGLRRYGGNGNVKSGSPVSFPRTGSSGTSDVETFAASSGPRRERGRRNGLHSAVYDQPPCLDRSSSITSDFSIVIQPADPLESYGLRERDDAFLHVAVEELPVRIKHVLQKSRCWDMRCSMQASHEHFFHDDLSATLEALREVDRYEMEDVKFDKGDAA